MTSEPGDYADLVKAALQQLGEWAVGTASYLKKKIPEDKKRKQIGEFLRYRQFLSSHRKLATVLAASYYKGQGLKILEERVPLLYEECWIPENPIELEKVKLNWAGYDSFPFDQSVFAKEDILPLKAKSYALLQKELMKDSILQEYKLTDDLSYRLIEIENNNGLPLLNFVGDTYYKYVDTCELLSYEFCKEVVEQYEPENMITAKNQKSKVKPKLREKIAPFDLRNRSAAVGINTILVLLSDSQSSFYLHNRSTTRVVEAMGTIHVVPAGGFSPRHKTFIKTDFNLYKNIMRELGEELLGRQEFEEQIADRDDIFDVRILKSFSTLMNRGLGKAYYLGIGLDCLTTKPEILTALVLDKEAIESLVSEFSFTDNYEGERREADFTEEILETYISHERMLPAGAGCLWLVKKQFPFFCDKRNHFPYAAAIR